MTGTLQGTREPQPVMAVDIRHGTPIGHSQGRQQAACTLSAGVPLAWHKIQAAAAHAVFWMYARLIAIRTYLLPVSPYVRVPWYMYEPAVTACALQHALELHVCNDSAPDSYCCVHHIYG